MNKLKCKPGDIALVVEPALPAPDRSGLLVEVMGPFHSRLTADPCWLVRPVGGGSIVDSWYGAVTGECKLLRQSGEAAFPDAHLFPLPGEEDALDVDVGRAVEA